MNVAPALKYIPVRELGDARHVVVDGAARPETVLALSHWPGSPTPPTLARDLSTEIALAYLDSPEHWLSDAEGVTNDHLDEDGLAALFALTDPPTARAHAELLVEIARVGDFGVVRDLDAAMVAFAVAALADPSRSPLAAFADRDTDWTARGYRGLLEWFPRLLASPLEGEELAAAELAHFLDGTEAIARGDVVIDDRSEANLAIVTFDPSAGVSPDGTAPRDFGIHRAAIHSATDACRILLVAGQRIQCYDRYETWVRFVSRPLPLRRDLRVLARRLNDDENYPTWRANGPSALVPLLSTGEDGTSSRGRGEIAELIESYLDDANPAWDPWSPSGPLIESRLSEPADPRAGTSDRGRSRWRGLGRARSAT